MDWHAEAECLPGLKKVMLSPEVRLVHGYRLTGFLWNFLAVFLMHTCNQKPSNGEES